MGPQSDEEFEVKCPKCKRRVKVDAKDAERTMQVKCPCGEEIPLAKMI
jgi:DNA-directed RNA polymerase subunit RPC12/RpoP